ncbi:MAG: hypothetical protein H6703_16710 [Myxococcales bacterium]|nr:hypothetical protein [Myxococcales bacterium]
MITLLAALLLAPPATVTAGAMPSGEMPSGAMPSVEMRPGAMPPGAMPSAPVQLAVPYVEQGRAPWCAAAAAVMVMASQGHPLALRPFVATLRVHADGVAWLDLAEGIAPHGFEALVAPADAAMLHRALAAGLAPIALLHQAGGVHAIVVTGRDATGWQVLDPTAPGRRHLAADAFERALAGGVLIRRMASPAPPDADRWRQGDARYRAEEWRRRAADRVAAGAYADGLALLDRALAVTPDDPELRAARALLAAELARSAR